MTTTVVQQKLENLRRCLARIRAKVPPSAAALAVDLDAQDIVAVNLERAVQIAVDLATHVLAARQGRAPATMADAFQVLVEESILDAGLALRLRRAVALRNILVHEYQRIDWGIVFAAATVGLADLELYARTIASHDPG